MAGSPYLESVLVHFWSLLAWVPQEAIYRYPETFFLTWQIPVDLRTSAGLSKNHSYGTEPGSQEGYRVTGRTPGRRPGEVESSVHPSGV